MLILTSAWLASEIHTLRVRSSILRKPQIPFLIEILPIIIQPIVTIFEVIITYVYPLPTRIVPNPVLTNLSVEVYLEKYCHQRRQTPFKIELRSNLDCILTSMDTINSSINRQFLICQHIDYIKTRLFGQIRLQSLDSISGTTLFSLFQIPKSHDITL